MEDTHTPNMAAVTEWWEQIHHKIATERPRLYVYPNAGWKHSGGYIDFSVPRSLAEWCDDSAGNSGWRTGYALKGLRTGEGLSESEMFLIRDRIIESPETLAAFLVSRGRKGYAVRAKLLRKGHLHRRNRPTRSKLERVIKPVVTFKPLETQFLLAEIGKARMEGRIRKFDVRKHLRFIESTIEAHRRFYRSADDAVAHIADVMAVVRD
jgi:hypothetical protein